MSDYKKTNDLTEKTTPVDADLLRLDDSADSFAWKKATIANVSTKVQADLIANSTNYNALGILMKGYKEYTFAIRQSGTDAPTIYVIKDDFELETALTFTYASTGVYHCNITTLGFSALSENVNICIGNSNAGGGKINAIFFSAYSMRLFSTNYAGVYSDGLLVNDVGVTISIRETLS